MKRPLAYITAAGVSSDHENTKLAAQYCRTVYEAGFSPICPTLYRPLFRNDAVPEEHKSGIDMGATASSQSPLPFVSASRRKLRALPCSSFSHRISDFVGAMKNTLLCWWCAVTPSPRP